MHLANHDKEDRPWGTFERFTLNESSTVKIITVLPGASLSLQTHAHRDEFWRILAGSGDVVVGEETFSATPGQDFNIPQGPKHRVIGGPTGMTFLEIAFGVFDEADITRLSDIYGRA